VLPGLSSPFCKAAIERFASGKSKEKLPGIKRKERSNTGQTHTLTCTKSEKFKR